MGKNYISLQIGGQEADLDPEGQVPKVSYALEDSESFENKPAATAFDIQLAATLANDQIHNTLHDPSVQDNSASGIFDNFKPAIYIANGIELLIGKYLQDKVISRNGRPVQYQGKIYGLNGDWVIDLKEKTLLDFVNSREHVFDVPTIAASWAFDGRSEVGDYVYAPVRYLKPFGDYPPPTDDDPAPQPTDDNVIINDLKPSISIYWILYRAFKSVGYRLVSKFMDTDFYRRSTLPWTWGGFDYVDDTRWEPLKFLAGMADGKRFVNEDVGDEFVNLDVKANNSLVPGTYDNSGLYSYTSAATVLPYMMMFQYPTAPANLNLGKIRVNLSAQISYDWKVQLGADIAANIYWYKNGIQVKTELINAAASDGGVAEGNNGAGFNEFFYEDDIVPGDYIGARIKLFQKRTSVFGVKVGFARQTIRVEAFQLNFVKLTDGSIVSVQHYSKFKNYLLLDLLRGEIDCFDLSIQTDPVRKEIYIEPTHPYEISGADHEGYYNHEQIDWSQKVDQSKDTELELFSDYEREFIFEFQDDPSDGGLKKVQDRNQVTIGQAKYLFPERFKTEQKEKTNRFYAPVMHADHLPFKEITGIAPQLIAMIPENIANTSASESENTFAPKRAWYKGNVSGYGGWKFMGTIYNTLPYMFAVNYKAGGENDPVLSYADQLIAGQIGKGLMKKFFLQRMAIFRNGRRYNPINVMLNNTDISNFLHRESIIIENIEYLLTEIKEFDPISPESTACTMWMFVPVGEKDKANCFPSLQSLRSSGVINPYDIKYWTHTLLPTDIPK